MTPAIIEHLSPNHSSRKGARVDCIVIHHTGTRDMHGRSAESIDLEWLCNPASQASAHYLIGRDGQVWRLVPESEKAWHAGESHMPWKAFDPKNPSVNPHSIGIELVNPGDGVTPFTEAQYEALAWLVPDIVRRQGMRSVVFCDGGGARVGDKTMRAPFPAGAIGVGYILGHRDVAPGRKTDPADNFDWGRVRSALAGGVA